MASTVASSSADYRETKIMQSHSFSQLKWSNVKTGFKLYAHVSHTFHKVDLNKHVNSLFNIFCVRRIVLFISLSSLLLTFFVSWCAWVCVCVLETFEMNNDMNPCNNNARVEWNIGFIIWHFEWQTRQLRSDIINIISQQTKGDQCSVDYIILHRDK